MTDQPNVPATKRPHQSRTLRVAAAFIAVGAFLPQLMPVVDIVAGLHNINQDVITAVRACLVGAGIVFGQLRVITSSPIDLSRNAPDQ